MHNFSLKKIILSPFFILLFFELLLFVTNYLPGTYFLGWDNLFPEMNFPVNFQRIFVAMWQEYRGLGLLDGMSFAANLPHYLILNIFSLILPKYLLRYFFVFLMHFIGGVGIYLLLFELFNRQESKKLLFLFGGLFYQLNLITVQMFFVIYEVFAVHFAFLPLLFYFTIKFLRTGLKKDLVWFGIFSFLAIPQAHVPTLFIVYLISLFSFLGIYVFKTKKTGMKRAITILLLTFLLNAFWGLPYLYSAFHNSKIIVNSKINLMSTEDVYLKNKAYGDLRNIILMKGFGFDFVDIQSSGINGYMMQNWREHTRNKLFIISSFLFFGLSIIGLIKIVVEKMTQLYPVVLLFLFSFLMLGNNIPGVREISTFLYSHIPYFSQIFRFTFTKFSILYAVSFSVLLTFGLSAVLDKVTKIKYLVSFIVFGLFLLLGYNTFPSYKGDFLYKNLRAKVPDDYFELVKYFNSQDKNTRIALFPQPSFYGWTYTRWGYRGSGFIWYGIPQPTLDGAFYPWSQENENYYWEMTYAIYSKNRNLFENVIEKYQINWLLVDEDVISLESSKALFLDELDYLLTADSLPLTVKSDEQLAISNKPKFELVQTFGKIKIFKVNLETGVEDFVWLGSNLPVVNGYEWGNKDKAYDEMGQYQVLSSKYQGGENFDVYYPFRSLFTGRTTNDLDFEIEDKGDKFVFKKFLPKGVENYNLVIPQYKGDELVEVDKTDLTKVRYFIPTVSVVGNIVEVVVPKVGGIFSVEIDPTKVSGVLTAKNCNQFSGGEVRNDIKDVLTLEAEDANNCSASFWLPDLPHKYGYLISAETKNISGKSLLFWVENLTNRKADMELYLDFALMKSYLVQPPMAEDGLGYSLHFDNISIGRKQTINDLGRINVNPIPYEFLMGIKLVQNESEDGDVYGGVNVYHSWGDTASHLRVEHLNPEMYEVRIKEEVAENTILVLSQAYHEGWRAYAMSNGKCQMLNLKEILPFLCGKEIKEHVKVNNWENGWQLGSGKWEVESGNKERTIILFFWPQYLEYAGFVLLIIGITGVLLISQKFSILRF